MKARIVQQTDLLQIVRLLREQGYEVFAPFQGRAQDVFFEQVTDANQELIQFHFPNPNYPPKRDLLPPIERLMKIRRQDGTWEIQTTEPAPKRAIFGIRSCDVAAIGHSDRFYLGREFRDIYYERRRQQLFLVNFVCSDPARDIGEACFCLCTDTGPAARQGFDLQLMDLDQGEYMAVAGSPAGEALLRAPIFQRGNETHIQRRRTIQSSVRQQFKSSTSWFPNAIREVSIGAVSDQTWEQIGRRCLECGGCTYVSPRAPASRSAIAASATRRWNVSGSGIRARSEVSRAWQAVTTRGARCMIAETGGSSASSRTISSSVS